MSLTKIYLIRNGDFVKIGRANDAVARWQNMQTNCPTPLVLLGWIEAEPAEEQRLHRKFARYRAHGEWFLWCPELEQLSHSLVQPTADELKVKSKRAPNGTKYLRGRQLRAARHGMGLSLKQLARMSRVSTATIMKFEAGQRIPIAGTAFMIRDALERIGVEFPDFETVRFPTEERFRPNEARQS